MRRLLAGLAMLAALLAASDRPAHACGGALYDDDDRTINRARRALDRGDYPLARTLATEAAREVSSEGSPARARRIEAMAWVRDENAPERELRSAMQRLLKVRIDKPVHDVQSASDLGEALARFPEHEDEALAILEPLAARDLIGSPATYLALARITKRPTMKLHALERCSDMIEDADYLGTCRLGVIDGALVKPRHASSAFVAMGATLGGSTLFAFAGGAIAAWRRRKRR